ncbi:hypothetical protein Pla123a_46200 [Posidoniimonas polymericola]|uniref:Uncharacterized protein n=1 Tax=Posidoniimonas polymericola TaxID=2528002 RepID=A0A5C5XZ21_9BACT|nr:hypothetical protein Pla123a_46200 [Posidoniimonas polymericola]
MIAIASQAHPGRPAPPVAADESLSLVLDLAADDLRQVVRREPHFALRNMLQHAHDVLRRQSHELASLGETVPFAASLRVRQATARLVQASGRAPIGSVAAAVVALDHALQEALDPGNHGRKDSSLRLTLARFRDEAGQLGRSLATLTG